MICPVCKTYNSKNRNDEFCAQCGADIQVHKLFNVVREEMPMKDVIPKEEKSTSSFNIVRVMPTAFILLFVVFGFFVGIRFLNFIEHTESHRTSLSAKWSETGFEQLQQMNATIKQELDLIIEQRRENQELQARVQELSLARIQNNNMKTILPSIVKEQD